MINRSLRSSYLTGYHATKLRFFGMIRLLRPFFTMNFTETFLMMVLTSWSVQMTKNGTPLGSRPAASGLDIHGALHQWDAEWSRKSMQENVSSGEPGHLLFWVQSLQRLRSMTCYRSVTSEKVSEGRFNQNEKLLLTDVKQKQEIHQTNITLQLQLQNKTLVSPKKISHSNAARHRSGIVKIAGDQGKDLQVSRPPNEGFGKIRTSNPWSMP